MELDGSLHGFGSKHVLRPGFFNGSLKTVHIKKNGWLPAGCSVHLSDLMFCHTPDVYIIPDLVLDIMTVLPSSKTSAFQAEPVISKARSSILGERCPSVDFTAAKVNAYDAGSRLDGHVASSVGSGCIQCIVGISRREVRGADNWDNWESVLPLRYGKLGLSCSPSTNPDMSCSVEFPGYVYLEARG